MTCYIARCIDITPLFLGKDLRDVNAISSLSLFFREVPRFVRDAAPHVQNAEAQQEQPLLSILIVQISWSDVRVDIF